MTHPLHEAFNEVKDHVISLALESREYLSAQDPLSLALENLEALINEQIATNKVARELISEMPINSTTLHGTIDWSKK